MILDDLKIRYKLRILVVGQIIILTLLLIFITTLFKKLSNNELKTYNSAKEVELIRNIASKINEYSAGTYDFNKLKTEYSVLKDTLTETNNLKKLNKIWKDVESFERQNNANKSITAEVMKLTDNSILQSNSYIEQVAKKLAHSQQRNGVSVLERMVLIGANTNTSANFKIKVLFYRMLKNIEAKNELLIFLDKAIENVSADVISLQNTPFAGMAVIALENNNTIKELALKYISNSESNYKLNENIQKSINLFITKFVKESVEGIRGNNLILKSFILIIFIILLIISIIVIAVNLFISNSLTSSFEKMIGDFKELAKGNIVKNKYLTKNKRKDELGDLERARIKMTDKLSEVISNVIQGANTIALAGESLNTSAQNITQGANKQASSSEEITASMEQMGANISENSNNAGETSKMAIDISKLINELNQTASKSLNSINNIADKISIIDDIAFQTNILSLNAAVEAARAGVHGKGFAVVASEVQKLAERSKKMANEISQTSLLSSKYTSDTKKLLDEIVPKIEKISSIIQEIAHASSEQNTGVMQVNEAISGFNDTSQNNAAISEELASSAEELAASADELKQMVSYFKIDTTSTLKNDNTEYIQKENIISDNIISKIENNDSFNKIELNDETEEITKNTEQKSKSTNKKIDEGYNFNLDKHYDDTEFESF